MSGSVPIDSIEFFDINSDHFSEVFEFDDQSIQISAGKKMKLANIVRGYTYVGMANLDTSPLEHPFKSYYIAVQPGEYTNFNLTLNSNEIGIFLYNSSSKSWEKEIIPYTPIKVITEDEYESLSSKDENTLYLLYEPE